MANEIKTQVLVIGSGPGGYSAAFRAADLDKEVIIVEKYNNLGGVCLNVGCIPSKALLHIAKVIDESEKVKLHGVDFADAKIDIEKIDSYKNNIVKKLTSSISSMAKQRKVKIINAYAKFINKNTVQLNDENNTKIIFEDVIIAAGSQSIKLPFIPHDDPRIWDSTDALNLKSIPKKLLILGGGIIGLEMATVYEKLGSSIDVVEMLDQLVPAADTDIIKLYTKLNSKRFNIMLKTKVISIDAKKDGIYVSMQDINEKQIDIKYDAILVAIGRKPNGNLLDLQNANVEVNEQGFIQVNNKMQTNIPNIYAIGDIVGQPMLAHKATHEGYIAAEVIAGLNSCFTAKAIPSIAYTFPEIAWVGLTQKEAIEQNINYEISMFPWQASGRAIASDASDGMTKLIFNKDTNKLIGGAIIGDNAGELLGEIALALKMDCNAKDIANTIHAHPTLHESIGLAAEIYECTITDLANNKLRRLKREAKS